MDSEHVEYNSTLPGLDAVFPKHDLALFVEDDLALLHCTPR